MKDKCMKKINEKIKNFNEKIENISGWKWSTFTFTVCLIAILSISVEIIWQPFLHAEDGNIFLKDALEHGRKSLFFTYGGYFGFLPRIFAILAIHYGRKYNSIILITMIMKWCSILFSTICINYINSEDFKNVLKGRIIRLLTSVFAIFIMSNYVYMLYNATCVHWWGGLLAFLVGLVFLNKKTPSMYIIPFLILAILSSPSALIIAIPICYYIITKLREDIKEIKNDGKKYLIKNKIIIIKLIIIAIAGITQVYGITMISKDIKTVTNPNLTSEQLITVVQKVAIASLKNIPYSFTFNNKCKWIKDSMMPIIGGLIWIIMLGLSIKDKKTKKIVLWCFIEIFILYFMDFYKFPEMMKLPANTFYNSIPSFTGIFAVINFIYNKQQKLNVVLRGTYAIIFIAIIIMFFKHTEKPYYGFCPYIYNVENSVNFNSETIKRVDINPGGDWKVDVPVS